MFRNSSGFDELQDLKNRRKDYIKTLERVKTLLLQSIRTNNPLTNTLELKEFNEPISNLWNILENKITPKMREELYGIHRQISGLKQQWQNKCDDLIKIFESSLPEEFKEKYGKHKWLNDPDSCYLTIVALMLMGKIKAAGRFSFMLAKIKKNIWDEVFFSNNLIHHNDLNQIYNALSQDEWEELKKLCPNVTYDNTQRKQETVIKLRELYKLYHDLHKKNESVAQWGQQINECIQDVRRNANLFINLLSEKEKLALETELQWLDIIEVLLILDRLIKQLDSANEIDETIRPLIVQVQKQCENLLSKYKIDGLLAESYQELSRKWQAVRIRYALLPHIQEVPELPDLASLTLGVVPFLVTHNREIFDKFIGSPFAKGFKFSTQQAISPILVDNNPNHLLFLAPMIFTQGRTPTIDDVKNLCKQHNINSSDLCVINCVEDSEMGQVGRVKPATKEDWGKKGFNDVRQLNIANRTFLTSGGYNIGDRELFTPFSVLDLEKNVEKINKSPSLVYCSAAKSRSVIIAAAAIFKRCWDNDRQFLGSGGTEVQFCSISSVIKDLHILRPESTKNAIEKFSDAGQSLTLLLFCWRVIHTDLKKIKGWLNQEDFIHDVEITLKKLIAPSHVEEQLLALPESVDDIKNFVEVLNKFAEDKLDKLLREVLQGQNYCHFLTKLFDVIGTGKPSEEVRKLLTKIFSILIENPRNACDALKSMYQTVQSDELVFAIRLAHMYLSLSSEQRMNFKKKILPYFNKSEIIYKIFDEAVQPHEEKLPRQDINDSTYSYIDSYINRLIENQTIFVNSSIKEAARNLAHDLSKMNLLCVFNQQDECQKFLECTEKKFSKTIKDYSRWYNTIMSQIIFSYNEELQDNQYESLHPIIVTCINTVFQDNFEYIYISKEKLLEDLLYFQLSEEYCTDITSRLLELIDGDIGIIETAFKRAMESFTKKEVPDESSNDYAKFKKELECKLLAAEQSPYYQSIKNRFSPDIQIETSGMQTQITLLRYMHLAVMVISEIERDKIPLNEDAKRTIVDDLLYTKIYPDADFNDTTSFQTALSNVDKELANIKRQLFQKIASSVNESLANRNKVDDKQLKLLQALIEKGNYESSDADQLFENLVVDISEHPPGCEAKQELAKMLFKSVDITCFDNMKSFLYMYVRAIRQYMFKSIQGQELVSEVKNDEAWHAVFYSMNTLVKSKKIINVHDTNKCSELFTSIINLVNNLSHGPFKPEIVDRNLKTYSVEISANDRDKFKIGCDHVFCIIKSIVGLKDNFFTQITVIYGILRTLNTCLRFCIGAEPLKHFEEIENAYFSSLKVIYGELINFKKQQVTQDKILAVTEIMREFCFNVYQIRKTIDFYIKQALEQIHLKRDTQTTEGSKGDQATAIELLTDELTRLYFYSLTHYPDKLEQFVNNILKHDYTLKEQSGNTYLISMLRRFIYHNYDLDLNNFKDFLLIISVLLNNEKCCSELIILEENDAQKLINRLLDDKKFRYFNISQFDQSYLIGKCLLCMDDSIFRDILNRNNIQQKLPFIFSTFTPDEIQTFYGKDKDNKAKMIIRNNVLQNPEEKKQNETLNNERLAQETQDFNTKVTELNTNLKQLPISTVSEEQLFQISGQIIFCQFHINSLRQKQRILGSHNNIGLDAYQKLLKYLSQRLNCLCPKEKDHYLDLLMMHLNLRGNSEEVNSFVIQFAQRMNLNTLSSNALNKAKQTLHRIINSECIDINTLYLSFIAEIRSMTWKNPEESNKRRSDINEQDHVAYMPSLENDKDELEQFVRTQFSDLDATNKSFYEERVLDKDVLLHLMKHGNSREIREFVNCIPKDKKRSTIVTTIEKYKGKVCPDIEGIIKVWLDATFIKIPDFCKVVSFDYFLGYLKEHQNKIPEAIDSFKSWLIDDDCDYVKRCLDVIKNKSHIVKLIIGVFADGEKVRGPQAVNLIKEWYEQGYIKQDQFKNVVSDKYFAKYYTEETSELIKNELGYKSDLKLDENSCLFLEILKQINQAIKEYDTKIEFFRSLFAAWFVSIPENYHNVLRHFKTEILYIPEDQESQTNISFCSSIHSSELHLHVVAYFTIIAVIAHSQNPNILQIKSLKNLGIPNLDLNSLHDIFSNVIARIISNDELPTQTKYTVCSSIFKVQKIDRDNVLGIVNSQSLPESLRTIIKNIVDEVLPKYVPQSPVKKILNPIIGSSKGKVETEKTTLGIDNKLKELKNLYSISDVNNKLAIDIVFLIHKENFSSEAKEKIINCLYDLIKSHALEGLQLHQLYGKIQLAMDKLSSPLYLSIQLTLRIIADFLLSKSQNDFDSISVLLCGIEFCCHDSESLGIQFYFANKLYEWMHNQRGENDKREPNQGKIVTVEKENDMELFSVIFSKLRLVNRHCFSFHLIKCLENISELMTKTDLKILASCIFCIWASVREQMKFEDEIDSELLEQEKKYQEKAEKLSDRFEQFENDNSVDNLMVWIGKQNKNAEQTYRNIFIQLNRFYRITYKLIFKLQEKFQNLDTAKDFLQSIHWAKADVEACRQKFNTQSEEDQYRDDLQKKCANKKQLLELVKQEFIDRASPAITLGNFERAFELWCEYRAILKECFLEDAVAQMMINALTKSETDEKERIEKAINIAQDYLSAFVKYRLTHKLAVDFPQVIDRLMDNANQKLDQRVVRKVKNELMKQYSFEAPLQKAVNQWASLISKVGDTDDNLYYDYRQLLGVDINPTGNNDQDQLKRTRYSELAEKCGGKFVPVNQERRTNDEVKLFSALELIVLPTAIVNKQMRSAILLILLDQLGLMFKTIDVTSNMIFKATYKFGTSKTITDPEYPYINITPGDNKYIITFSGSFNFLPNDSEKPYKCSNKVIIYLVKNQDDTLSITLQNFEYSIELEGIQMKFYLPKFPVVPTSIPQLPSFSPDETQLEPSPQVGDNGNSNDHSSGALASLSAQTGFFAETESRNNQEESCLINDNAPQPP